MSAWRESSDPRVRAVPEVLAGDGVPEVATRWSVEPALVRRWVRGFVDASTAQVTNRPAIDALRTPLTTAQGWAALLAEGDVPPAAARTVARLEDALVRLAERVRDVELLAAASMGLLRPEKVRVPLADLLPGAEVTGGFTVLHRTRTAPCSGSGFPGRRSRPATTDTRATPCSSSPAAT
ncbi:hypothetical protein [Nocardioides pyridinolyticus]